MYHKSDNVVFVHDQSLLWPTVREVRYKAVIIYNRHVDRVRNQTIIIDDRHVGRVRNKTVIIYNRHADRAID